MALINLVDKNTKEDILRKAKKTTIKTSPTKSLEETKRKVLYNLREYKDKYKTITSIFELEAFLDKALENGIVSLDTETLGLNPILDGIVGISLATYNTEAIYIPINHISPFTKERLTNQLTEAQIKGVFERKLYPLQIVWFNANFDVRVLKWSLGLDTSKLNIYFDCLIGSHLLNENEKHNLKYLYNKYILNGEEDIFRFNDLFGGTKFSEIDPEIATIYAAHDADMHLALYDFQKQFLLSDDPKYAGLKNVFLNIEMPCISAVIAMEDNGVLIDKDYVKELSDKYSKELENAQQEYYRCLDSYSNKINQFKTLNPQKASKLSNPINYASPEQLGILLYDIIGVNSVSKDSPRGTSESILQTLNLPICEAILKCRGFEKLLKTYINKITSIINPKTNKIHTFFNQCGTVTGRFSSSDVNLQNIPSHNKDIRKMFVADEGCVLIGSDYSQQEPRCLASMCNEEHLIQAYKDSKDIYAWIASMIFKVPYEECKEFRPDGSKNPEGKERRSTAKAIVLGIMYSKGPGSIASDLGITREEADNIFNTFFKEFPKIKDFIDNSQAKAFENGFVETAWGRKRRLPDLRLPKYEFSYIESIDDDPINFDDYIIEVSEGAKFSYTKQLEQAYRFSDQQAIIDKARKNNIDIKINSMKIEDAKRQCVNSIIQGTAADMVKLALVALHNNQQLKDLGFKLLMTIHDEIIGQCPRENAKEVGKLLSNTMIQTASTKISVPMKCDVEVTERWYGDVLDI